MMNTAKTRNKSHGTGMAVSLAVGALALPMAASAATTITIDSVTQRWPWNNKLDITYTVTGGQDLSTSNFCKIVFTTVIDGTTYTIDGVTDVGASANDGTHTVTWNGAPAGVKSDSCTMSAAVYEDDAPSGDDYMVVDLDSGAVTYEGMLATQEASNGRYNTADYKTGKLVLRKVPAGTYPTGERNQDRWNNAKRWLPANINSPTNWVTDRAYYIGVFPVTQTQYSQVYGSNPSVKNSNNSEANPVAHRPVENVSWDDLRLSTTASTSAVPTVASSGSGTFLQRLNFITGNKFGFDLPTEVMYEIAHRAGTTTMFPWGDTWVAENCVNRNYPGSPRVNTDTVAVGSCPANGWGFYDMPGNVYEWCLDDFDNTRSYTQNVYYPELDQTARPDAFTPAHVEGATSRRVRGGGWAYNVHDSEGADFRTSARRYKVETSRNAEAGFRVSMIVQ